MFVWIILLLIVLLILAGVLIWLSFDTKKQSEGLITPSKQDIEELVIAVCNEDVDWVDDYAEYFKLVTIYNKCGKNLVFESPNVKIIEVPNIGSCDYAYLSYIIDRYDTLPDFVEFTKGWVPPKRHYYNCKSCKQNKPEFDYLMNFSQITYDFTNPNNKIMNDKFKWHRSGYKNMNDWIKNQEFLNKELFEQNICNVIYGGHFGTTKNHILKTPKYVWELLHAQQKYPREEVDHFIERAWGPLLCRSPHKLVVVTIFKNEAVAMREWLEHYVREGVEHFYMIDNGSTDNWQKEVEGFPVTIYSDMERYKQNEHYNKYFLEEVKRNSEWVMVVDLDEFMYARKGYKTIPEYLVTLKNGISEVQVRWKMFGSNGHIKQPKSIIKGFTKRQKGTSSFVKSIARSRTLSRMGIHTHIIDDKSSEDNPKSGSNISENIILLPNITSEEEIEKVPLHLNHYAIQSWEWYRDIKMTRGSAITVRNDNVRTKEYFQDYDHKEIEDNELDEKLT